MSDCEWRCGVNGIVCRHPPYGRMEVRLLPVGAPADFRCIPFSFREAAEAVLEGHLAGNEDLRRFTWWGADEITRDDETWAICEVERPVVNPPSAKSDDRFPHDCIFCGRKCYSGFDSVEHADGRPCKQ